MILPDALEHLLAAHERSDKPMAAILAGHNGSGKSTLWYRHLSARLRLPLVNADRMMMALLPPVAEREHLPVWAAELRDRDTGWMQVAQRGVQDFIAQAVRQRVSFATETVFSHWQRRPDGSYASKLDLIHQLQDGGYFVVLIFVGLAKAQLSVSRVASRVAQGGHDVAESKLLDRFERTRRAVGAALQHVDAALLFDNSFGPDRAFTVARLQVGNQALYDLRDTPPVAPQIAAWLNVVAPLP